VVVEYKLEQVFAEEKFEKNVDTLKKLCNGVERREGIKSQQSRPKPRA